MKRLGSVALAVVFLVAATIAMSPDQPHLIVSALRACGTVLIVCGVVLRVKANLVRRSAPLAPPQPAAWLPPTVASWDDLPGAAGAPGPPATLVGVGRHSDDDDPDVVYLGDGLATADGRLIELGTCSACGASRVVRTNRSTRVRHLGCSDFPRCRETDRLRRATRMPRRSHPSS